MYQCLSAFGYIAFMGIAWLFSAHRRKINLRLIVIGSVLQILFGVLILKTPFGKPFFSYAAKRSATWMRRLSQPPPSKRMELGETALTRMLSWINSRAMGSSMKI